MNSPAGYLREQRWRAIAVASSFALAGLVLGSFLPTTYEASVRVEVEPIRLAATDPEFSPDTFELDLQTQARVARSIDVELIAADLLGERELLGDLVGPLGVAPVSGTTFLRFEYTHADPATAQRRVQAFAEAFLEFRRRVVIGSALNQRDALEEKLVAVEAELRSTLDTLAATSDPARQASLASFAGVLESTATRVEVDLAELADIPPVGSIPEPASEPSLPASPDPLLNGGIGLAVGVLVGLFYAARRNRLGRPELDEQQIEDVVGAPVVGVVPRSSAGTRIASSLETPMSADDPYRSVALALRRVLTDAGHKVVMVTSTTPSELRVISAARLASAYAASGLRTVLVSTDPREGSLTHLLGRAGKVGLADVLRERSSLSEALESVAPDLDVMSVGQLVDDHPALVGRPVMSQTLLRLGSTADVVVLDTSPILGQADSIAVAPAVDAVVLVVDAVTDRVEDLGRVRRQLAQVDASIVGVIVLSESEPRPQSRWFIGGFLPGRRAA